LWAGVRASQRIANPGCHASAFVIAPKHLPEMATDAGLTVAPLGV